MIKIIPEWRKAWKLASVQVLAGLQFLPDVLQFVLSFAPEALRAYMDYAPSTADLTVYRGALLAATIARLVYQPKVRAENGNLKED